MMLERGDTLIARSIGFTILRHLDVTTDADRTAKRNLEWYRANISRGTGLDGEARDALAHESDWRRMDDEIEIVRSSLQRAGLPIEPPQRWTPPSRSTSLAAG